MATQVADQPPTARFDEEALSPVSKLEAARKAAAIEQQKRVDAAYARLVSKKETAGKRKALEARLDGNAKSKLQKTVVDASEKSPNSISRRLMDRFQTDPEPEQENLNPAAEKVTRSISTQFVTRTTTVTTTSTDNNGDVVVATSAKLDEVISKTENVSAEAPVPEEEDNNADENLPSTAFHVKQLGLTDEKVDIYAPPEVQQQELRKIRERSMYLPPQPKTIVTLETKSDSEADSDFDPEASESDDSDDSEISDVESVDASETKELEAETQEFALSEAAKASAARRSALKWFFVWVPLYVIGLCLLLLAVLFLIDWSQEHYEFCPVDAAATDDAESLLTCGGFVSAQTTIKSFLREALENARASAEQYLP